jgi:hypothetical protein
VLHFLVWAIFCRSETEGAARRERTVGQDPLNTPLNRLMMQSHSAGDRKEREIFAIGQQYTGPFDAGSPVRFPIAIDVRFATSASPIDSSIICRHAVMTFDPRSANQRPGYRAMESA